MQTIKLLSVQEIVQHREVICELLYSCVLSIGGTYEFSVRKYMDLVDYISKEKGYLLGTYQNEELVAICWCYKCFSLGDEELHIAYIASLTKYQRQGIGYRLVLKAEELAKELGINIISLHVDSHNEIALDFYKKCGFKVSTFHLKKECD